MKTILKSDIALLYKWYSKYFSGLLSLGRGVILQNVLWSFRIKTFYNLDKIHIVGKTWVSRCHMWCFFVVDEILRDKLIDLWQKWINKLNVVWMAPGGCFWYNASTKLHMNLNFCFISTSNFEHNLCGHTFYFYSNFGIIFFLYIYIYFI